MTLPNIFFQTALRVYAAVCRCVYLSWSLRKLTSSLLFHLYKVDIKTNYKMGINWSKESKPYIESPPKKKSFQVFKKQHRVISFRQVKSSKVLVENITYVAPCVHNSLMCVKIRTTLVTSAIIKWSRLLGVHSFHVLSCNYHVIWTSSRNRFPQPHFADEHTTGTQSIWLPARASTASGWWSWPIWLKHRTLSYWCF